MNIPYVKQYNKFGIVTNPIEGKYVSKHPNRRQTRQKDERKFTNGKGVKLLVKYVGNGQFVKFRKRLQLITKRVNGRTRVIRTIVHYDEVKARA